MKRKHLSTIFIALVVALCMALCIFLPACSSSVSEDDEEENKPQESGGDEGGNAPTEKKELVSTTVYMVGDSTMCSFDDTTYYYPRYGYGTQLGNYLDSSAEIVNLAMSGRSSKSFLTESNYTTLTSGIKAGDYLIIGFGHNDEKSDDSTRYTSPELNAVEIEGSFQKSLYDNYVKVAIDAGATPILCTPIVRANKNNNYSGTDGHIYDYGTENGNYAECIRDLAETYNLTCIDLTALTSELYTSVGYDTAIYYHAWTTSNSLSVDTTHLNIYGAKEVSYLFATALADTESPLGEYVLDGITAPTKDNDLVVNENYTESEYETPDFNNMDATYQLGTYQNVSWYKTVFGETGSDSPYGTSAGYLGTLDSTTGTFTVGQKGSSSAKGKISSSSDGISYIYTPLDVRQEFSMSATVTVKTAGYSDTSGAASAGQEGFGIMLRDDIYLPTSNYNNSAGKSILSNYVASGMYNSGSDTITSNVIYSRENTTLKTSGSDNKLSGSYKCGDTATIKIERSGGAQNTTCTVVYDNTTYTYTYYDFDYAANDYQYSYLCFYATRGTVVEFTNVQLQIGEIGAA